MTALIFSIITTLLAISATVFLWVRLRVRQASYDMLQQQLQAKEQVLESLRAEIKMADGQYHQMREDAALARQQAEQLRTQMAELRSDRERFMEHAKAAAFETGQQISTRLMQDHKREREHAQKQIEQLTKNTTESLMKNQRELAENMSKMHHEVNASANSIQVLVRAMKHPIGAGAEAEIGFDNLLSALGLRRGQDYDLQFHMASEEGNFRPDALIYLPNDQVMVVDCKASQHIYQLFEAEGTDAYDAVFQKLCGTMRAHIRQLASKQYVAQLQKHLQQIGRASGRLVQVMYVPNDEVITRLRKHDPEFGELAIRHEIMLAGPDTLPSLFMLARGVITEARQNENQQKILTLTQDLIADVITALNYAGDMGKAMQRSSSVFEKFIASLNRRALPKMRKLQMMGLSPSGNKDIPPNLGAFKVITDDIPTIEAESEEAPGNLQLQNKKAG